MLDAGQLAEFVEADNAMRQCEADLLYWKHRRQKAEAFLLDQMGMQARKDAVVELEGGKMYKVYTRRTSGLRVTSPEVAEAALLERGLDAFIDIKIDTARLGSYYKKVEAAEKELPVIPGLEYTDSYRLYVMKKR